MSQTNKLQAAHNKGLSRRNVLKAGAAGLAFAAAPAYVKNAFASSGELNVFSWVDYVQDNMIQAFEKETGIKVNLSTYGSNEEAENKMKASGGKGFDVLFPSITNVPNYSDDTAPGGHLLAPINESKVNMDNLISSFARDSLGLGADFRGKRVALPFNWGTEGITYNSDKLHLNEVSYGDLWQPQSKGKAAFRQKSMIMGTGLYLDSIGVVKSNRMLDVYKSEADARRVWGDITKWALGHCDNFGAFWNNATEATTAFKDAGAIIGQTWDTTGLLLNREDAAWKYRAPKEGIITWLDSVSLSARGENSEQAYAFINFLIKPEIGGMMANNTGYNSAVIGAEKFTSDTYKRQFSEVYNADVLSNMWWWQKDTPWFSPVRNEFVEIITNNTCKA